MTLRQLSTGLVAACVLLVGCGSDGSIDDRTATEPTAVPGQEQLPGYGRPAALAVENVTSVAVSPVEPGWPSATSGEVAEPVEARFEREQVEDLLAALSQARYVELGPYDYDLVAPDREVAFLSGDELLFKLGYYATLHGWGEHDVPGRWLSADWELLAVEADIPPGTDE